MNYGVISPVIDIEKLGEVILVPRNLIRPFPNQPRKFFDQQKLKELAASIKSFGQRVPGLVKKLENNNGSRHIYEMVDGQRRWHAIDMAGQTKMKVIVVDIKDEDEQFLISVISNFGRADHGPLEIGNAILRFKNSGMTAIQIAEIFAMSDQWVWQYLKVIEKVDPEVKAMMAQEIPEERRLKFSAALLIADVPQDLQKKIADTVVEEKLKIVQVKDFIRARAAKMGFSVGSYQRNPNKDHKVMCNFIGKMRRELEVFNRQDQEFFDKMFQNRESEDHDKMMLALEGNIEKLRSLFRAIRRAKKK